MNIYKWAKKNIAGFLQKVLRITVYGAENEPLSGGVIAASNHTSFLDVIVLGIALKRQIRFLAKAELFKIPLLNALIRNLGAYSVERGKGDVAAIKKTISLIEDGELVGIFPQGHRHKGVHPRGTEIKNGIGMVSYRAGATVLPIFIKTKNYKMKLIRVEMLAGMHTQSQREGALAVLMTYFNGVEIQKYRQIIQIFHLYSKIQKSDHF